MSFFSASTYKLAVTQQALATMGADTDWDARITAYLRTYHLMEADEEFGVGGRANEAALAKRIELEGRYGKGYRQHPAAQAEYEALKAMEQTAEDERHRDFVAPHWAALRELAVTPAPTLAAACFKQFLIQSDEIWNDGALGADCMQIVIDDFARLAG